MFWAQSSGKKMTLIMMFECIERRRKKNKVGKFKVPYYSVDPVSYVANTRRKPVLYPGIHFLIFKRLFCGRFYATSQIFFFFVQLFYVLRQSQLHFLYLITSLLFNFLVVTYLSILTFKYMSHMFYVIYIQNRSVSPTPQKT